MRKIGDKVKIKSTLDSSMYDYISDLEEYVGQDGIIKKISFEDEKRGFYKYLLEDIPWTWYDEYFE
jgi:hypothetical protein